MPFGQEILLILFSSFHSLYVLRNTLPPLTFASLNRLILWNVAVHISKTNQRRLLLYLLKIQRTNGVSASGSNLLRSTLLWADSSEIRFIRFLISLWSNDFFLSRQRVGALFTRSLNCSSPLQLSPIRTYARYYARFGS